MPERHIAVALSGGGHRASAFALGVLLYLANAGKTAELGSVASVSGGSLANGAVAQDLDLSSCSPGEVEALVARVARRLTGFGTLFGATITWIYLLGLPMVAAAAFVGPWLLPVDPKWQVLACLAGVLFLGWYVGMRGRICGRAFAKTLFTRQRRPTRLDEIHNQVEHVICATDLHAGEHVYFSGRFVYGYRFGLGQPGDLGLYRAVQASAAFPGAFPVSWMRTARFAFADGQPEGAGTSSLALHDGGVYDNMADQWAHGLERRLERCGDVFCDADELIVANASAGLAWASVKRLHLPWAGELFGLLRDKSVLYDNGNSVRRRELVARFDLADREGRGLRGALVHIPQSPFTVPDAFEKESSPWPKRAERAKVAQAHLLQESSDPAATRAEWRRIATANAAVSTTLVGLSRKVTARLVHHAYVLAMVNLHVILDYPLVPIPRAEDLEALIEQAN